MADDPTRGTRGVAGRCFVDHRPDRVHQHHVDSTSRAHTMRKPHTRALGLLLTASLVLTSPATAQDERSSTNDSKSGSEEHSYSVEPRSYLGHAFNRALERTAIEALEVWGPWASAHGYTGYLSPDQTVLFFALERRSGAEELATIERVAQALRTTLPTPRTRNRGPITGTGGPTTKVYPLGGDVPLWKHDLDPIDEHTGVLFELDSDEDFADLLARVGDVLPSHVDLRHLGERSRSLLTEDVSAYVWRVGSCPDDNQVAHAAAQFAIAKRFPFLPAWLRDGLAWHAEEQATGSVRCLPDSRGESSRDFVEDWRVDERVRPFEGTWAERLERLHDFGPSERYVLDAGLAFLLVEDLCARDAQSVSNAAEELRLYWEDHSVRHHPAHGFERRHDYRTPTHIQGRILSPLLGLPMRAG